MIIGIGTDIVQIPRVERIISLYNNRFAIRILAESELERMQLLDKKQHVNFLSKRFAAKEAISKAFGTGIRGCLGFKNIIISNDTLGKPTAEINGKFLNKFPPFKLHLSIADDYPTCIAFAIVSQK